MNNNLMQEGLLVTLLVLFVLQVALAGVIPVYTPIAATSHNICIGNTVYTEIHYPNGSMTRMPVKVCPYNTYCLNGVCEKRASGLTIGPWYISLGPWCFAGYIGKPYCVGNDIWRNYRTSKCGIEPRPVRTCEYGCYGGICNPAPESTYSHSWSYGTTNKTAFSYSKPASSYGSTSLGRLIITQKRFSNVCQPGWVCISKHWKAYRTRSCNYLSRTLCINGCKNGYCKQKECIIPDGSSWDCDCDIDADCPAGYYCQQRAGPDACKPIKNDY